jgi:hypothetical protein
MGMVHGHVPRFELTNWAIVVCPRDLFEDPRQVNVLVPADGWLGGTVDFRLSGKCNAGAFFPGAIKG